MTALTEKWLTLVYVQGQTLTTMGRFKKPADISFLFAPAQEAAGEIEKLKRDRKTPINEASTVMDGCNIFSYPAFEDAKTLVESTKEFYEQISFYGNRILKSGSDEAKAWYEAYHAVATAVKDFVLGNVPKIMQWTGAEDAEAAAAYFKGATANVDGFKGLSGGSAPAQAATAAPTGASAPAGADLGGDFEKATKALGETLKAAADKLAVAQVSKGTD